MPTTIAVVTQEESEPNLLPNANRTSKTLPFLDPLFVPQFPKKKLLQMKLWAKKKDDAPAPEPNFIQVPSCNRGSSSSIRDHRRYTTPAKSHGNKKKDKAIKSKKKTGQAKHPSFPKAKADCKETVQLANTLPIQYLKYLVNTF
jgi:hypothetical protein